MSNDYYNNSGTPGTRSSLSSAAIRTEFASIAAGLDKLAPLTGNGGKFLKINASGTGHEVSALISESGSTLLIGGSASRSIGGAACTVQIERAVAQAAISLMRNTNDAFGGTLALAKSRGTVLGSSTIVQSGDVLGEVVFAGADGTDAETQGALIHAAVDGTPGADDLPTRLVFSTTADGAAIVTERMRIDSAGNVGVGLAAPTRRLHVMAPAGVAGAMAVESPHTACAISLKDGATAVSPQIVSAGDDIYLQRGGAERIRAHGSGATVTGLFGVGKTAAELVEFFSSTARARVILETTAAGQTADIQLKAAAGAAQWQLLAGSGSTHNLTFNVLSGIEVMRLSSNGHVKIGPEMATSRRLTVGDDASAAEYIQVRTSTTGASGILFCDDSTSGTNQGGVLYEHALDQMTLRTANSPAMVLTSSGNVGVGIASPVTRVHAAVAGTASASQIRVSNDTDAGYGQIQHIGSTFATSTRRNNLEVATSGATADITFLPNGGEVLRLRTTGALFGHNAPLTFTGAAITPPHQFVNNAATTANGLAVARFGADASAAGVFFGKSRSGTLGTHTIVQSGDGIGFLSFQGSDGTNFISSASISAAIDGTPGANDMPGRLMFLTTPDGAAAAVERLRITSGGEVIVTGAGGALGYGAGSGGSAVQATSKSTGVPLNAGAGRITMNGAALAANTAVSFTLTNSVLTATDVVVFSIASAGTAGAYTVQADSGAAGSCRVTVRNLTAGSLSEALVLNFAVIKAITT